MKQEKKEMKEKKEKKKKKEMKKRKKWKEGKEWENIILGQKEVMQMMQNNTDNNYIVVPYSEMKFYSLPLSLSLLLSPHYHLLTMKLLSLIFQILLHSSLESRGIDCHESIHFFSLSFQDN